MKSLIKKNIYASLGMLSVGTDAVKHLGQELASKAKVSEAEGERIARKLQAKSSHAVKSLRKTLDSEVTKIADMVHATIQDHLGSKPAKAAAASKAKKPTKSKKTRRASK